MTKKELKAMDKAAIIEAMVGIVDEQDKAATRTALEGLNKTQLVETVWGAVKAVEARRAAEQAEEQEAQAETQEAPKAEAKAEPKPSKAEAKAAKEAEAKAAKEAKAAAKAEAEAQVAKAFEEATATFGFSFTEVKECIRIHIDKKLLANLQPNRRTGKCYLFPGADMKEWMGQAGYELEYHAGWNKKFVLRCEGITEALDVVKLYQWDKLGEVQKQEAAPAEETAQVEEATVA